MASIHVSKDKKKVLKERASLIFEDEASFRQDSTLHATWATKGSQPQVLVSGQRKSVKVFACIDLYTSSLIYERSETFNAINYLHFLATIKQKYRGRKVHLIHDNASYHTDARITEWFDLNRKWITQHRLPPYCPELNPAEKVWKLARKHGTHNQYFQTETQLVDCLTAVFTLIQRRPALIRNYLRPFI